ncbi:MAG: hypothetical protein HDR88_01250 [Bacteroides sp.]|nr:hypothetical protein [Bacteroides sp.]
MNCSLLKKSITAAAALVVISSGATPKLEVAAALPQKSIKTNRSLSSRSGVFASQSKSQKKATAKTDELTQVLVEEDFSLWTEGTQEEPIYIGEIEGFFIDDMQYDINPDRMQNGKTWGGKYTCTAGGICALTYPGLGGMIQTSEGQYSGDLHITAKVKMLENQSIEEGYLNGAVCYSWMSPRPVPTEGGSPYNYISVPNDGEWHNIDWRFTNTYGGDDCFIQFNTNNMILIDDIKVTADYSTLANPQPLPATDFTIDGFTANWRPVNMATDYLLTCWRDVPFSDEAGQMVCNFDDINNTDGIINMEDPNFPEGWEFDFNGATPRLIPPTDGVDSYGFLFDTNGQSITSPSTGSPIVGAALKLQVIGEEIDNPYGYYPGRLSIEGWDGYNWQNIGGLYFDSDFYGDYYLFDEIGMAIEMYGGSYYNLRFSINYLENGYAIAVDDIEITTLPPTEKEFAFTNLPVEGTSYVVTGLDPYSDYYYQVSARNTELGLDSGEPTACTFAFGLPAPTPLSASDIDAENYSFTANWESTPKAQQYLVNNFLAFTAPEATENYPVLEEYFEKADVAYTTDDPYAFNNFEFINLDTFCDNPGWIGYLCGLAEFAIGGVGIPAYGYGGQLQTPWLSLGNNDGKFKMLISACGTPGDYLCVENSNGEEFQMPLTDEYTDYELEFTTGTDFDCLTFYTYYKYNFFINYVEVTQDLKKGDNVLHQRNEYITADTSWRFTNLEKPEDNYTYAYTVTGIHSNHSGVVYSDFSTPSHVEFKSTGIGNVEASHNINARAAKGTIMVVAPEDANINIVATNGIKIASFTGSKTVNVPAGMYFVKAADKTFKLIVK